MTETTIASLLRDVEFNAKGMLPGALADARKELAAAETAIAEAVKADETERVQHERDLAAELRDIRESVADEMRRLLAETAERAAQVRDIRTRFGFVAETIRD